MTVHYLFIMVATYTHIIYTQTLEQGVYSHVPQDDKIILIILSHSLKPILVKLYKSFLLNPQPKKILYIYEKQPPVLGFVCR